MRARVAISASESRSSSQLLIFHGCKGYIGGNLEAALALRRMSSSAESQHALLILKKQLKGALLALGRLAN